LDHEYSRELEEMVREAIFFLLDVLIEEYLEQEIVNEDRIGDLVK